MQHKDIVSRNEVDDLRDSEGALFLSADLRLLQMQPREVESMYQLHKVTSSVFAFISVLSRKLYIIGYLVLFALFLSVSYSLSLSLSLSFSCLFIYKCVFSRQMFPFRLEGNVCRFITNPLHFGMLNGVTCVEQNQQ